MTGCMNFAKLIMVNKVVRQLLPSYDCQCAGVLRGLRGDGSTDMSLAELQPQSIKATVMWCLLIASACYDGVTLLSRDEQHPARQGATSKPVV